VKPRKLSYDSTTNTISGVIAVGDSVTTSKVTITSKYPGIVHMYYTQMTFTGDQTFRRNKLWYQIEGGSVTRVSNISGATKKHNATYSLPLEAGKWIQVWGGTEPSSTYGDYDGEGYQAVAVIGMEGVVET